MQIKIYFYIQWPWDNNATGIVVEYQLIVAAIAPSYVSRSIKGDVYPGFLKIGIIWLKYEKINYYWYFINGWLIIKNYIYGLYWYQLNILWTGFEIQWFSLCANEEGERREYYSLKISRQRSYERKTLPIKYFAP